MHHRVKKPYLHLCGRPILAYALSVLDRIAAIKLIIVAVYPGEEKRCHEQITGSFSLKTKTAFVAGGATRQESVRNALQHVPDSCGTVLIHDGVRPLVSGHIIRAAIKAAHETGAVATGVPAQDTTVLVSRHDTISGTLPRDRLWIIQTPQVFEKKLIREAHRQAFSEGFTGTDDASLVERLGIPVKVIRGSYTNIKITTREDLRLAEALLNMQAATRKKLSEVAK